MTISTRISVVLGISILAGVSFLLLHRSKSPRSEDHAPAEMAKLAPIEATDGPVTPSPNQAPAQTSSSSASNNGLAEGGASTDSAREHWKQPVADSRFERFRAWSEKFLAADAAGRAALEEEGVELARQRRAALLATIESNPRMAIESAVPFEVRREMPGRIASELEELVSATGEFSVLGVMPLPGQEGETVTYLRRFSAHGVDYEAFAYGERLDDPTKRQLPLWGVALADASGRRKLAVAEDPVRRIPLAEAAARHLLPSQEQICAVNPQNLVVQFPTAEVIGVGDSVIHTCSDAHTKALLERLRDEAGRLDRRLAAAGGSGSAGDGDPLASDATEGRKRYIMFRIAFSNLPTPDISSNQLVSIHAAMNVFWRTNSYGHTTVAPLGQGSDIVLVTLANPYTTYDGDAGLLRTDVRNTATAQGIDLSRYDYDIIYTGGGQPSFSFGGLGFVGAPGSWVVGASSPSITAHETGHNLGFPHANYWDTRGLTSIGPGGNQEYGDPYDVMGGGSASGATSPGHYTVKFKQRIDWIPAADFPVVSTSGLHRIYVHDNWDSRGKRGIRFNEVRNGLEYFLDFRQLYPANLWIMNGVGLRWGSRTGFSSQLIDTTPGTTSGKTDAPIVIGRTFSDPASQVHITPLGKGGTYPESIDVQVNFGLFPGNLPPTATLSANATNVGVGTAVIFTATASDPNGDPLAYYWEFDDNTFGTNGAVQSRSFQSVGDYRVRVEVSDTKGGLTSDSIIVRVGTPATFTISGRVLSNNVPMAGVLVKASSARYAYTDSDGTYTITRLTSGSYNLTAAFWTNVFVAPFRPQPISVGPSADDVDFVLVPGGIPTRAFVSHGSVWKFRDNGVDLGTAWTAPGYADTAWASGPGQFGYGEGDEATVVSFGGNANNKYITTYFRRSFFVTNLPGYTNFTLSMFIDDGAVVYLNGTEVFRNNLPTGVITFTTTANDTVDADSPIIASLSASSLVEGTNVLAVEVHQSSATSSDLSFDLSLGSEIITNLANNAKALYIASPGENSQFTSPADVLITASALPNVAWSLVEFFADAVKLGETNAPPYTFTWSNPGEGSHLLSVRGTDTNSVAVNSAFVRISVVAPVVPGLVSTLVPANATWRYFDLGTDPGSTWMQPNHADDTWSSGPALLGYGDPVATTISFGPNASLKYPAYFFRHAFNVVDAGLITNLSASVFRDDSVRLFLNGVEVIRNNLPAGTITEQTFATATVDGTSELDPVGFAINPGLLQDGTNVLAADVHQVNATSSDVRFGLTLTAVASAAPAPGVRLTSPLSNSIYELPTTVRLSATAIPAPGESVTLVEFYDGAVKVGEAPSVPYTFDWINSAAGAHTLVAVSSETGGLQSTSAPVTVVFAAPRRPTQLVGPGAIWRYLDDGSDQGTAWRVRPFDDSFWFQGNSRLGFGGDGEVTTVNSGPANFRYITSWFRRTFTIGNPASFPTLKLRLKRDDGVVVYINGTEVLRNNLGAGLISYNSLALGAVEGADEQTALETTFAGSMLIPFTNLVAVEIHQASITDNDLGFDLELVGLTPTNTSEGIYLLEPAQNARFNPGTTIALSAYAVTPSPVTLVEYFDGATKVSEATTPPFAANWNGASTGAHSLTARATFGAAETMTSPAVDLTVGNPPAPIMPVLDVLVPTGAQWRYQEDGSDRGTAWRDRTYNDATWSNGVARFGFGLDGERTLLTNRATITTYYRRWFPATNPGLYRSLIFQMQRDDGAVVYLNGVEIFRSNMPQGAVAFGTLASATANGLDEQAYFSVTLPPDGSGLVNGTNLIAVEVHQSSPGSSDSAFDLQLLGVGNTEPRLALTTPANGSVISPGLPISLNAYPWPGTGGTVEKVEFYNGNTKIGEANAAPHLFEWLTASIGQHTLSARMFYNGGSTLLSGTVHIEVGNLPLATNFINAGSAWRYLDDNSVPPPTWTTVTFSDAAWSNGVARLGYGDPAATVIRFGANANNKFISYYFRRAFVVPPNAVFTNLNFSYQRDDGAVIYLNGVELFRDNMPTGTVIPATRATAAVSGAAETQFFTRAVTVTNLPPGTNVIAVEIHQSAPDSSDLGFDLGLAASGYSVAPPPPPMIASAFDHGSLVISWLGSATGFTIEGTATLENPNWQPVAVTPVQSGGRFTATIPATDPARFFRLRR